MAEALRPEGIPVSVQDVVVTTPGLTGQVEVYRAGSPGMRGAEQVSADFQTALVASNLSEQLSVLISGQSELTRDGGTRAGGGSEDIVVEVPAPGDGNGQVVLYAAEDGSLSWHLPENLTPEPTLTRGGDRRTYRVPRAVVATGESDAAASRGVLGALGVKVLKVLVFPLIDPLVGAVSDYFARRWEAAHHPTRVRWMGVDDYASGDAVSLTDADWSRLGEGRALLFVHGIFSTAHGSFGHLPRETMTTLHDRYDGRVFALDHPTVSVTPRENVDQLFGLVPDGVRLRLDIVTHSSGGLLGRELAASDGCEVHNLVMVAAPNAGTPLADRQRLSALLDRVTALTQFIPSNGVTDTLSIVFAVLKQLAVGAVGGLDGITVMQPGGPYLEDLNHRPAPGARVAAIAADYEPPPGAPLARLARDGATDLVFARESNDLVVPTEGCWSVQDAEGFPIADRVVIQTSAGVDHNSYFSDPAVIDPLLEWLNPR